MIGHRRGVWIYDMACRKELAVTMSQHHIGLKDSLMNVYMVVVDDDDDGKYVGVRTNSEDSLVQLVRSSIFNSEVEMEMPAMISGCLGRLNINTLMSQV